MIMMSNELYNYFILFGGEFVEVDDRFFNDLIDLYSTKFRICKFNDHAEPFCEKEMLDGDSLYYYLYDNETKLLELCGKVSKISSIEE